MTSNESNVVSIEGCTECFHHVKAYGEIQCLAMRLPKPAKYMRHELSDCGPTMKMFDPKDKLYSEYQ